MHFKIKAHLAQFIVLSAFVPLACLAQADLGKDDLAFWKEKVHPLLQENCWKCHGAEKKIKGDLVLSTRQGILDGGEIGPAVNLEKPESSLILEMISYKDEDHQMPPIGKLADDQIATLAEWIKRGLPFDPKDEVTYHHEEEENFSNTIVNERTKAHWAYVKPVDHVPPKGTGAKHPIDAFILERLRKEGLPSNGMAEPATLLRRAHFDLVGLPRRRSRRSTLFSRITRRRPMRKRSTACSHPLTTGKNGVVTGWTWFAMPRPTGTSATATSPWRGGIVTTSSGPSTRTSPTTASFRNSLQAMNCPRRMPTPSPPPAFSDWGFGTMSRRTGNLPATTTWTTSSALRATPSWPCPLDRPLPRPQDRPHSNQGLLFHAFLLRQRLPTRKGRNQLGQGTGLEGQHPVRQPI